MVKTRVRNPGPAALLVINGGKKMARRRKTSRRRSVARHTVSNPIGRRRHHVRRRHNPSLSGGILQRGIVVAAGGMLTQAIVGFIPQIGGASPLADIGRTLAAAWLAGAGVDKLGGRYGARYAQDITLGGIAVVGAKMIGWARSYVMPKLQAVAGKGVSDVITLPRGSYDSYFGSTPTGMRGLDDVVAVPRFQNY